jgi:hypothetical protein
MFGFIMKKTLAICSTVVAGITLVAIGFFAGARYSAKTVQEQLISYEAGVKMETLRSLKGNENANATLFLERELAGQLAALQDLDTERFLTPKTSPLSKAIRTKGAIYFSVFPRTETSSQVSQQLIADLAASPVTSPLTTEPVFTHLGKSSKREDILFAEVLRDYSPTSLNVSQEQFRKKLQRAAEQGGAANPAKPGR